LFHARRGRASRYRQREIASGALTYQVIDLRDPQLIAGVGYHIRWDRTFRNPLTMRVEISRDNRHWQIVSNLVHHYAEDSGSSDVNADIAIAPAWAHYVRFGMPPDGEWNGWGEFVHLRVYAAIP
jgi:hypothetical protein